MATIDFKGLYTLSTLDLFMKTYIGNNYLKATKGKGELKALLLV